jgi:putative Mg2+ transporter-C (MgtC) family protein
MNAAVSTAQSAGFLDGQSWKQAGELGAALLLSAAVGVEREIRQKHAGLRTHTLVGLGAALFMLVSKYGFNDVIRTGQIMLDPSRMAAQIVSGIGFIGAGLIFVRRDSVRGLTTAASVWVTAAIGCAAGAGLLLIAAETTAVYLVVVAGAFPFLARALPRPPGSTAVLRVRYTDGRGALRRLLQAATARGFIIDELSAESLHQRVLPSPGAQPAVPLVEVHLRVHGKQPVGPSASRPAAKNPAFL